MKCFTEAELRAHLALAWLKGRNSTTAYKWDELESVEQLQELDPELYEECRSAVDEIIADC